MASYACIGRLQCRLVFICVWLVAPRMAQNGEQNQPQTSICCWGLKLQGHCGCPRKEVEFKRSITRSMQVKICSYAHHCPDPSCKSHPSIWTCAKKTVTHGGFHTHNSRGFTWCTMRAYPVGLCGLPKHAKRVMVQKWKRFQAVQACRTAGEVAMVLATPP